MYGTIRAQAPSDRNCAQNEKREQIHPRNNNPFETIESDRWVITPEVQRANQNLRAFNPVSQRPATVNQRNLQEAKV